MSLSAFHHETCNDKRHSEDGEYGEQSQQWLVHVRSDIEAQDQEVGIAHKAGVPLTWWTISGSFFDALCQTQECDQHEACQSQSAANPNEPFGSAHVPRHPRLRVFHYSCLNSELSRTRSRVEVCRPSGTPTVPVRSLAKVGQGLLPLDLENLLVQRSHHRCRVAAQV